MIRHLVLSPHTDDIEISMYGLIKQSPNEIFDIVNISNGGNFDNSSGNVRVEECKQFWKSSNLTNVNSYFLDVPAIGDCKEDELVNLIETKFDLKQYNTIFTTSDRDRHFEHRIINSVAWTLVRRSKIGLIEYQGWSSKMDYIPNYFVDVTGLIDEKVELLLNSFDSQVKKGLLTKSKIESFHKNFFTLNNGVEYCENFRILLTYK